MPFTEYVAKNFRKPTGFGGLVSTLIMNAMNQKLYLETLKWSRLRKMWLIKW